MAERYQKIEFKDFSGGGLQQYLENDNQFLTSLNTELDINTKKVKIAVDFDTKDIGANPLSDVYVEFGGSLAFIGCDFNTGHYWLYSQSNNNAIASEYDFDSHGIVFDEAPIGGQVFNNYFFFQAQVGGVFKYYKSLALASGWAPFTGLPTDQYLRKSIIVNNTITLFFDNCVYQSTDLANFTKLCDISTNFYLTDAEFYNGFFYQVLYPYKSTLRWLTRIENGQIILQKKFTRLYQIETVGDYLAILTENMPIE